MQTRPCKHHEILVRPARRNTRVIQWLIPLAFIISACSAPLIPSTAPSSSTSSASTGPTSTTTPNDIASSTTNTTHPPIRYEHPHIFVIVMENLSFNDAMAVGTFSTLAKSWAYASQYYAVAHPSLPNYLALISGSTFNITSDCTSCYLNAANLGSELSAANITWAGFMESIPQGCYLSPYAPSGLYAGKHDPFRYFNQIRTSAALCSHIQPLQNLFSSLSSTGASPPSFSWITPNICNDGHNCAPAMAANWLSATVNQITASQAWKDQGALYVTWDEGSGGDYRGIGAGGNLTQDGGGHVLTLLIQPSLPHGYVFSLPTNHYGLLKSIEENFHLHQLGYSASPTLNTLP